MDRFNDNHGLGMSDEHAKMQEEEEAKDHVLYRLKRYFPAFFNHNYKTDYGTHTKENAIDLAERTSKELTPKVKLTWKENLIDYFKIWGMSGKSVIWHLILEEDVLAREKEQRESIARAKEKIARREFNNSILIDQLKGQ